jgi:hypothetical protein
MRTQRIARRVLPWLGVWLVAQAVLAVLGRLLARRFDEGDEGSASIRRVRALGGLELTPWNPELGRVHLDLVMAGAELDLTGLGATSGVEVTVDLLMGGVGIRVPPDWRVWSRFRGVGGLGTDGGVQRTSDEHAADLRVRGRVLFGGIGVGTGA